MQLIMGTARGRVPELPGSKTKGESWPEIAGVIASLARDPTLCTTGSANDAGKRTSGIDKPEFGGFLGSGRYEDGYPKEVL
jgi:hypothetical protein